jgi:hypothetical protein
VSQNTSPPPPDPGASRPTPDGWQKPTTPRADATRGGFVRRVFSAAWWRPVIDRLTRPFRRRRADDWVQPPWRPLDFPERLNVHEPQDNFTLETPALGDAFNFVIRIRCSWCVQATATKKEEERRTEEVRKFIADSRPTILERIEDTIRPIARTFPPYRAAEAEQSINTILVGCLADGDVQATIRARVDVCEPIREDLRKVWRERLVADAAGDLKKAHVQLLGELQESWRTLLVKGLEGVGEVQTAKTGWIAPYALALAEDSQLSAAAYLQNMVEHRVSHAEELLGGLSNLVVDERIDEIEFAFRSDSALRSVLTYLGVPVPQPRADGGDGFEGDPDA